MCIQVFYGRDLFAMSLVHGPTVVPQLPIRGGFQSLSFVFEGYANACAISDHIRAHRGWIGILDSQRIILTLVEVRDGIFCGMIEHCGWSPQRYIIAKSGEAVSHMQHMD
jgi:hypothetical protein